MYWLFLLAAAGCFLFALNTPSTSLLVLSLLASLGFVLAWVRGRYLQSFGDTTRDLSTSIDPAELRRLREQAHARRAAQDAPADNDP